MDTFNDIQLTLMDDSDRAHKLTLEDSVLPVINKKKGLTPKNSNVFKEDGLINQTDRQNILNQKATTIWLTGLSGSGKSYIAKYLEKALHEEGRSVYRLDGDNIRLGLNKDLGFTHEDRSENIRRIAEMAKLFNDAGIIVISAFISPYREDRAIARNIIGERFFTEVFVDTPLDICEKRDPKGLYKKARRGEIAEFTGISSPYQKPQKAEVRIHGGKDDIGESVDQVMRVIQPLIVSDDSFLKCGFHI